MEMRFESNFLEKRDAQNDNHGENAEVGGSSSVSEGVKKKRGRKSKKEKEDMDKMLESKFLTLKYLNLCYIQQSKTSSPTSTTT